MNSGSIKNTVNLHGSIVSLGARGYSNYEIAVQNGFEGSEQEWLDSLVGPVGPRGPIGPNNFHVGEEEPEDENVSVWLDTDETIDNTYVPIATDELVGVVKPGNNLRINEKGKLDVSVYANNIEELKLSKLKVNDVVTTLGYYEPNDGGSGTYLIREKLETDIEDGGSIHFIGDTLVAELIIEDNVNVKQFGAKGDGVNDDTNYIQNAIDFASNDITVILPNTCKITQSLNIDGSQKISFDKINVENTDFAISIKGGNWGVINGNEIISNSISGGIAFKNSSIVQGITINVNHMNVKSCACIFLGSAGVFDSSINGEVWGNSGISTREDNSHLNNCFDVSQMTEYVGNVDVLVKRLVAINGYAINIDSKNTNLTGFNFPYCSLEGSLNGININIDKTQESIRGTFRTIEMRQGEHKILKISGKQQNINGEFRVNIDFVQLEKIDISELTCSNWSAMDRHIIIDCKINNSEGQGMTKRLYPVGPRMLMEHGYKGYSNNTGTEEGGITANNTKGVPQMLYTNNSDIYLPEGWDGNLLVLVVQGDSGTTIHFKQFNNEYITKIINEPGTYLLMYTLNNDGTVGLNIISSK